jgi:hypothetical protein
MRRSLQVVLATISVAAGWIWTRLYRLAVALRLRRPAPVSAPSDTRRRYVFGTINRRAFDAALRKARPRRSRRRRRANPV